MTVKAILDTKGREVVTIAADKTLREAAELLAERRIGAVVVMDGQGHTGGILSERDIVRAIAADGPAALERAVGTVMTARVKTCRETHTVNEVMQIMTQGRFRHLPVEKDGRLAGIISIGDVVKRRIEEVEREADEIRTYIATA
ncbi:CBS domain-containing protein [Chelativorans sp.]|uniref:CBS domain-containing protein n=1 Tax=Chelativorans sp. TaxID=2203393 RepID=UPI002811AC96|nr:CBS domain-containing protein [Chelativorans sp.]